MQVRQDGHINRLARCRRNIRRGWGSKLWSCLRGQIIWWNWTRRGNEHLTYLFLRFLTADQWEGYRILRILIPMFTLINMSQVLASWTRLETGYATRDRTHRT